MSSSLLYSIDVSLNCNLVEAEPAFLAGVAKFQLVNKSPKYQGNANNYQ